jgi:hypothetical protein
MKSATNNRNAVKNVQNLSTPKNDALMVISKTEEPAKDILEAEKDALPGNEKVEEVKAVIEQLAPTAEDRIKRAANFGILTAKFTHLKMKNDELEKFIISSDGTKEKLVLENSGGAKIEVNNSLILGEVTELLKSKLTDLLQSTENEVKNFVI